MGERVDGDSAELPRAERQRRRRERRFVDAAKTIVADQGFEALTMQRLADELDLSISAVYRYFPTKGALVRQVQIEAIEQLSESLNAVLSRFAEHAATGPSTRGDSSAHDALVRLVLVGSWLCAASLAYPEDLRLLQMIMSQRSSNLDPDGGWKVLPVAMELVGVAMSTIEEAQAAGVIREGNALDRSLIWASALGGVLQTDDLEQYAPELFGGTRLARQANLDLLGGWGATRSALAEADRAVREFASTTPLAP